MQIGDDVIVAESLHTKEGKDLVIRTFGVKLDLGMLIRSSERFDRGLPHEDIPALEVFALTQAFRPKLAIEKRETKQKSSSQA